MKPNIGIVNALIRITCGLTMVTWAGAELTRRRSNGWHLFCVLMGAMKVGEGITRFCPVVEFMAQNESDEEKYRNKTLYEA
ncbi:DUF2892 domain-containing protein [Aliibacillus thermotolerans]|uniref:DUF2892 domain-containing protein n=1 Tax=Aliibacillus thermotolerans TaxID=1834418 RepID=A0ABW0U8J3_9BACI|nr:DUF2892 domain-containing protein [Aliibacillus thermotolerans]MDA3130398.1 DUF2892 domain-containing protein [Aliibacillus thermotolerans]